VPRCVLQFLAQNRAVTSTKVILAYLLRGLSIAPRTGEIANKGTVKASWIAETFDLSPRAVKYAQAELRAQGWITKDTHSFQRKLNRDGAYFVINLKWRFRSEPVGRPAMENSLAPPERWTAFVNRDKPLPNFALPSGKTAPIFAPPIEDQETSDERSKDQKAQTAEPKVSGVYEEGRGEIPSPTLRCIRAEDLWQFGRLEELYFQAIDRRWLNPCESAALNFIAAAIKAREAGHEPVRLFVAIVRRGLWQHITQSQEERARRALVHYREHNPDRFRRHIPEISAPSTHHVELAA
jgi:hypothetical protein